MTTLNRFANAKLDRMAAQGLKRFLRDTHRMGGARLGRDGGELVSFCCNDYLDLTRDHRLVAAARAALDAYGAGAGASRLITGNHPLYGELERRLADVKGTEAACVFGSGYLANAGVIPALAGPGDLVLIDAFGHASMHMGARASRAETMSFAHNDAADCAGILAAERAKFRHCLIATEGVFSMDGDRAPLDALAQAAAGHDAWLLVDDAHGFGVLGGGRGSAFEYDPPPDIPLQIGTLSKAVGGYGGFLCASAPVIAFVRNRARSLIYTTGLPPAVVAASIAAVDIVLSEPERVAAPLRQARRFCARVGLDAPESPIVPLVLGDEAAALSASAALEEAGFLVAPIRPPTVPAGTSRLRFTFTAAHADEDVDRLAEAVLGLPVVESGVPLRAA